MNPIKKAGDSSERLALEQLFLLREQGTGFTSHRFRTSIGWVEIKVKDPALEKTSRTGHPKLKSPKPKFQCKGRATRPKDVLPALSANVFRILAHIRISKSCEVADQGTRVSVLRDPVVPSLRKDFLPIHHE